MKMPKVSVVVPVFNAEKYIEKCVTSLMEQSYVDMEYIFVDDCSEDNSVLLLESIIQRYPNREPFVRLSRQKKNAGQAAARNRGIVESTGDYIAFVDSDDWVSPLIYEILVNNAIKEGCDISCCGIERVLNGRHLSYFNDHTEDYYVYSTEEAINELMINRRITCSPCDKIFSRSILVNNPMIEGMIFEDFEIMPRWIHEATKVIYTGKPLYYYRVAPFSTMSTVSIKRLDEVKASKKRISFFSDHYPRLLEKTIVRHIEICLNVLSCTAEAKDVNNERQRVWKDMKSYLTVDRIVSLSWKSKFKLVLRFLGKGIFDSISKIR